MSKKWHKTHRNWKETKRRERKFKAREFIIRRNRQHNLNNWLNQGTQYNIS